MREELTKEQITNYLSCFDARNYGGKLTSVNFVDITKQVIGSSLGQADIVQLISKHQHFLSICSRIQSLL